MNKKLVAKELLVMAKSLIAKDVHDDFSGWWKDIKARYEVGDLKSAWVDYSFTGKKLFLRVKWREWVKSSIREADKMSELLKRLYASREQIAKDWKKNFPDMPVYLED